MTIPLMSAQSRVGWWRASRLPTVSFSRENSEFETHRLRELVNRHQCSEKGFGPALGPASASAAERLFSGLGYSVQLQLSDWGIGARQASLQRMLVHGWLDAAVEMAPEEARQLQAWACHRGMQIDNTGLQISVSHVDVAGWLA